MSDLIKTNIDGLYKDVSQDFFINTNDSAYQTILNQRDHNKKVNNVQNELTELKKEFKELKDLLVQALNSKITGNP